MSYFSCDTITLSAGTVVRRKRCSPPTGRPLIAVGQHKHRLTRWHTHHGNTSPRRDSVECGRLCVCSRVPHCNVPRCGGGMVSVIVCANGRHASTLPIRCALRVRVVYWSARRCRRHVCKCITQCNIMCVCYTL